MPNIENITQLRALLGEPNEQVPRKIHRSLNRQAVAFIQRAPMLFLSTTDASGQSTVSPKGDGPGGVPFDTLNLQRLRKLAPPEQPIKKGSKISGPRSRPSATRKSLTKT